jgi:hypothetical protein
VVHIDVTERANATSHDGVQLAAFDYFISIPRFDGAMVTELPAYGAQSGHFLASGTTSRRPDQHGRNE